MRSDKPAQAIPHLVRGAEIALEAGDFRGVHERAERAHALGVSGRDRGFLLYLVADACRWSGDTQGAEDNGVQALDALSPGSEPWLNALRVSAFSSGLLGHLELLLSLVRRLLEIDPTPQTKRAWDLAANQATSNLLIASPHPLAQELLARTERVTKAELDTDPVAAMYHYHARSVAAFRQGHYERLLDTTLASVEHARRAGDVRFASFHATNVGFAYAQLGDYETALQTLLEGRTEASRFGLTAAVLTLDQNRGHVLMCLGRLEEARDLEVSVIAHAKEPAPRILAIAHACLARIQLRMGDPAEAAKTAQLGVDASPTDVPRIYCLASLSEARLALGDAEGALDASHRALEHAIQLGGAHVGDVIAGRVQVEALLALGRTEDARRVLEHPVALVRGRAASIQDPARRAAMLERVEDHRRVLDLEAKLAPRAAEAG